MGISELVVFLVAPFVFMQDIALLPKDGFMPLLGLTALSFLGCIISSLANHTQFLLVAKGLMANYGLFAAVVVMHRLLRNNLLGCRWFLLGVAISFVLATFVFQGATELAQYASQGSSATEGIMSGPLFWSARIGGFWVLPYKGWYMATPQAWNIAAPIIWGGISAVISGGSGRSMALNLIAASAIIFWCGKSVRRIQKCSKSMGLAFGCALVGLFILTTVYKHTASTGLLGEKARIKYERQVKDAKSPLQVLMAGRSEFFVGFSACLEKPLIGYGPWPLDTTGIYENWITKYGNDEDIRAYEDYKLYQARQGLIRYSLIPSHSVIIAFWLWYGISGLIMWLYVNWQLVEYMKKYMDAIPQ